MARNMGAFEVFVNSIYGMYLAPLENSEPDLGRVIYIEGACFFNNDGYSKELSSVTDEQYLQGEVRASARHVGQGTVIGFSVKGLQNYVVMDQEEIFSKFPRELALREERSPNLSIRPSGPTAEQKAEWDAEPQI